jgi:hypothetical protein
MPVYNRSGSERPIPMLSALQPLTPIVVKVVAEPPKDIGVIDIIFGSLGITGLMLVGSALLGIVVGVGFIWLRQRLARDEPAHAPSSAYGFTPSTVAGETARLADSQVER